ncbi:hypothetical protein EJB05_11203, partial [Eragrostis curvula]
MTLWLKAFAKPYVLCAPWSCGRVAASARRRRRNDQGADGDGVDRISDLPDDLLVLFLARLFCGRAAARTSVLSRRWRHVWRRLPKLRLCNVSPSALQAAMADAPLTNLSLQYYSNHRSLAAAASLLLNVARLDPMELNFMAQNVDRDGTIELPSFTRATCVDLLFNSHVTLTARGGECPVLEKLAIARCRIGTSALIWRCPQLRVLQIMDSYDTVKVHSTTLEELDVVQIFRVGGVEVMAPELKKFHLKAYLHKDFSMSLLAPKVQDLSWCCVWIDSVWIDESWCLSCLSLVSKESDSGVLRLVIHRPRVDSVVHSRSLTEIFQFPKFSVLELHLDTMGHVYEAMVLNLLKIWNGIRRLKLVIYKTGVTLPDDEACTPNCPCDQPQNWKSQNIFLRGLEEVEIENFEGSGHEVDLLKLLFRCALLKKVVVKLESKVSTSSKGCQDTYTLFKANPSVECNVIQA